MGADIYLRSKFDENYHKYEKHFDDAVANRDSADSEEERARWQKEVSAYLEKMYSVGYFRDSYNCSSLFWVLGLSWWIDVGPMLDEEGDLPVDRARELLDMVNKREVPEDLGGEFATLDNQHHEEWRRYFIKKRKDFIAMLEDAIANEEKLHCSV